MTCDKLSPPNAKLALDQKGSGPKSTGSALTEDSILVKGIVGKMSEILSL